MKNLVLVISLFMSVVAGAAEVIIDVPDNKAKWNAMIEDQHVLFNRASCVASVEADSDLGYGKLRLQVVSASHGNKFLMPVVYLHQENSDRLLPFHEAILSVTVKGKTREYRMLPAGDMQRAGDSAGLISKIKLTDSMITDLKAGSRASVQLLRNQEVVGSAGFGLSGSNVAISSLKSRCGY